MRITRAGFTDEDFYGSNDTDVVHFRFLHKLLRRVGNFEFSNLTDAKFVEKFKYQKKNSKYGQDTYQPTVTTMNAAHKTSDTELNPFIDDQLDKFYNDVVKPEIDKLNGRCDNLQTEVNTLKSRIQELENKDNH